MSEAQLTYWLRAALSGIALLLIGIGTPIAGGFAGAVIAVLIRADAAAGAAVGMFLGAGALAGIAAAWINQPMKAANPTIEVRRTGTPPAERA